MIFFLGNCQADFACRALASKGYDCTYRVLASPLTYPSSAGVIPEDLLTLDSHFALGDYLHGRELAHQFTPVQPEESPELIVLSLFHENTPLFIHNDDGYVFFMDPRALNDSEELMHWAQSHCQMFKPNPTTYLERFRKMLARMRHDFPTVPIIILSRLSHMPAFGPAPFSYLEGWDQLWKKAPDIIGSWAGALDDVHVLDMDKIFGGIWQESNVAIETHCPFLKIRLEEKDGQVTGLFAQRDIEHIGPMPERLADRIAHFLKTGEIEYGKAEVVRPEWHRQWRRTPLSKEKRLQKLTSGANYLCAEAIGSFFTDLATDHTELLVSAREVMPVCHMTLHMIKAYSRIWHNPALAQWCDTHSRIAEKFSANGPLYREAYLKRVQEIKSNVLN